MTPFRSLSTDACTAFEMGCMAAKGKPVLGYTHVKLDFANRSTRCYEQGFSNAIESYSAGTSIERLDMPDNMMMIGAFNCSGYSVQRVGVQSGEELTALAGFRMCLQQLRVS
jgi:nucleoside 2-deoxyribosyltransferase